MTYSHSVKLRSSVLGDIGPLTLSGESPPLKSAIHLRGTTPLFAPPTSFACFFLQSGHFEWIFHIVLFLSEILLPIVFRFWYPAGPVLICGQLACPRCFWMCFGLCSGVSHSLRSILPAAPVTCSEQSWSHRGSPFPSNCSSGLSWAH